MLITPRQDCGRLFSPPRNSMNRLSLQKMQKHSDSCEELKRSVCPCRHCFVKKMLWHLDDVIYSERNGRRQEAGCQHQQFLLSWARITCLTVSVDFLLTFFLFCFVWTTIWQRYFRNSLQRPKYITWEYYRLRYFIVVVVLFK